MLGFIVIRAGSHDCVLQHYSKKTHSNGISKTACRTAKHRCTSRCVFFFAYSTGNVYDILEIFD